jgi:hypothetical protein
VDEVEVEATELIEIVRRDVACSVAAPACLAALERDPGRRLLIAQNEAQHLGTIYRRRLPYLPSGVAGVEQLLAALAADPGRLIAGVAFDEDGAGFTLFLDVTRRLLIGVICVPARPDVPTG